MNSGSETSGDTVFDGFVESLEFGFRFARTLAQLSNMRPLAVGALFFAVQDGRQDLHEALGLQKAMIDVFGHQRVELFQNLRGRFVGG